MSRGAFIVLEGPDGAGKSTQARILAERLHAMGKEYNLTAEPTHGPIGRMIRAHLGGSAELAPEAIPALFAADRADHYHRGIAPSLAAGAHVVCDRYTWSNIAYRAAETEGAPFFYCTQTNETPTRPLGKACIWTGEPGEARNHCPRCLAPIALAFDVRARIAWARSLDAGVPRADLTIILSQTPAWCIERLAARGGAPERYENRRTLDRVCAVYARAQELAVPGERLVVIDNGYRDSIDWTAEKVWAAIEAAKVLA